MKKETIIAICFGILFGAVLALILLIKNKELEFTRTKTIAPSNSANQTIKNTQTIPPIEISQPQDGQIVNGNKITLKGKAEKDALIVIESAGTDIIFKNDKGQFSTDVPLSFGENNILITVYSQNPEARSLEKELSIYYLNQQL